MPPYFFRYGQEEIREFYLRFADALDNSIRIFLYNIPIFTNAISLETAADLLSTCRFAGIKDSSGSFENFEQLRDASSKKALTVMVGSDRIFARARAAGADGIVSGVASAVPELLVALDSALQKNLTAEVERLDAQLQEFLTWHDQFPTPVAVKTATAERGLKVGPCATPLAAAGQKRLEEFRDWFKNWFPQVCKDAAHA
jgi:4-hydroxy-tetrahydrodipicolinate synthase